MDDAALPMLKLLLAVAAFVLIGWFGARDKRIGGVLLTFPLLNGIAMLTGVDPLDVAASIFPIVMWNSVLMLAAMHHHAKMPPLPAGTGRETAIAIRALSWVVLWAAGAVLLTWVRDALPPVGWLFAIQAVLAAAWIAQRWRRGVPSPPVPFAVLWLNGSGLIRIGCFVGVFLALSAVATFGQSARWTGWASGVPLPGIFALAMLSATQTKQDLAALADTVLVGPLMVIPFNWLLSHLLVQLRAEQAGTAQEIGIVVLFWTGAALAVFVLVPVFARWMDARGREARRAA